MLEKRKTRTKADHIDLQVGRNLRTFRTFLGLSQEDVGTALEMTFQQIQKYELGKNKISASAIYRLSQFFKIPISHFYKGIEQKTQQQRHIAESLYALDRDTIELLAIFQKIPNKTTQKALLSLLRNYEKNKQGAPKDI
ncbi:MAG: helix-turn-helix domain-containing protein [Alphaproteobacteria bacterium]|nr:helix-turn-helix domain-containing protein [Alphaproteobacteria bacterium]